MRRDQELTRRHKGSGEEVQARGGVRIGRAGMRRVRRGHTGTRRVMRGRAGTRGQERMRSHKEVGESVKERASGDTLSRVSPLPGVWTRQAHLPDPELRPSPQTLRPHGRLDRAATVSHPQTWEQCPAFHSWGGHGRGSQPTSRAWGLTWEVSLAYFLHRPSMPMKSAWMSESV